MNRAAGGYYTSLLLGGAGEEGRVYVLHGRQYKLSSGILRQLGTYSDEQAQTREAFGFKWQRRTSYEGGDLEAFSRGWLLDRYLGGAQESLPVLFPDGCRVLDAGCGSGYSALLLLGDRLRHVRYLGVDISPAVDMAAARFAERRLPGEFLQADFTSLPFTHPLFDVIFAEGTLHHTDSTRGAMASLTQLLRPDGRIMFYVYRKKAPLREHADDLIREHLRGMDDAAAWEALLPLSRLGKAIGDLEVTLDVPEPVPYLGMPAGSVSLQRFFYWYVFKAFYQPRLSLDEMNHVNFDWYRPLNAHRHTEDEVQRWCEELGLEIERLDIQDAGITVVARRHGAAQGAAQESESAAITQ
jgi:arsenite methyltransferase